MTKPSIRRLTPRPAQVLAGPPRHPGLRPQVQDRLFRLQAECLRPGDDARPGRHRQDESRRRQGAARLRASTSAADSARCRTRRSCSMSFCPKKNCCRPCQAISRVFARLGEKRNRARARIKFLIAKLGIDEFRKLVVEERQKLAADPRWTDYLASVNDQTEEPLKPGVSLERPSTARRLRRLVRDQRLPAAPAGLRRRDGHACRWAMPAPIKCARWPTSRAASSRTRCAPRSSRIFSCAGSAKPICRRFTRAIKAIGLGAPDAATIVDVTSCPGTDTCKLGIASSRGLARRAAQALGRKEFAARRSGEESAHQDQRLLQLLRPASRRRHRLLRHQPQRQRISGAAFPGDARRQVARQRRRVRSGHRRGAVEADSRGGADRSPNATCASGEGRTFPGISSRASAKRRSRTCSKI